MKVLLLGSDGFIGKQVGRAFATAGHEVFAASIEPAGKDSHTVFVDLLQPETIAEALRTIKPEVVISAAGIVENSEKAALNVTFTTNLLEAAAASGLKFHRLITTGSAGEYGVVQPGEVPVNEEVPLRADSYYGRSKVEEGKVALNYRTQHHLPVVIARLFNPIGAGMHPRMLISGLIRQMREIEAGERTSIEVSRLDAKRDYVNVRDIATAYLVLVEGNPRHAVYNIGSGQATSNAQLIEFVLKNSKLTRKPKLVETSGQPEPLFAGQADITRINHELGWQPETTIEQTVKEIFDGTK